MSLREKPKLICHSEWHIKLGTEGLAVPECQNWTATLLQILKEKQVALRENATVRVGNIIPGTKCNNWPRSYHARE